MGIYWRPNNFGRIGSGVLFLATDQKEGDGDGRNGGNDDVRKRAIRE